MRDLGSTNGTRVNGSATGEIILHSGDRIRFGAVDARFEGDVPMSATQPLPAAAKVDVKVATTSIRPADFANASPFRTRSTQRDPGRTALFCSGSNRLIGIAGGNRRSADNARADAVVKHANYDLLSPRGKSNGNRHRGSLHRTCGSDPATPSH